MVLRFWDVVILVGDLSFFFKVIKWALVNRAFSSGDDFREVVFLFLILKS